MANKKISELNSAVNPQSSDLLVMVNEGETRKITLADFTDAIMNDTAGAEGSCLVATNGAINLSTGGLLTVDGVPLQDGDRVLAWQQTTASENGIYTVHSGAWTRAGDFNSSDNILSGSTIAVTLGSEYKKSIFQLTTTGPITVGTTALTIERITGWQFDETHDDVYLSDRSVTIGTRGADPDPALGIVVGKNSLAQGTAVIASADYSNASGSGTKATAINAHAEGSFTSADGNNSHAEGAETVSSGTNAHAEGSGTIAQGTNSHAEGNLSRAANTNSHAEGNSTTASGLASHAEGTNTTASGESSHTGGMGDSQKVIGASGLASFNHSFNSPAQTSGFGARSAHSAILGGMNHDIASGADDSAILGGAGNQVLALALRSVILGGQGITASDPDTAYAKIARLLNYLTIDHNSLLTSPKNNTVENDGVAMYYTNNDASPIRHHLATVENLRVSVPFGFNTLESESGINGRTLAYLISLGDVANYFPLSLVTGLTAVLIVDTKMEDATATGEISLYDMGGALSVAGSTISVPLSSTTYAVRKSAEFTLSPNKTYGVFMKRTGAVNKKIEIRSAQIILRPSF